MKGMIWSMTLVAMFGASAQAAFQVPLTSVRSASMGNSSASVDEAAALFTNPAGLTFMNTSEVAFMYNKMYTGLPGVANIGAGYIALGIPSSYGTLGLGVGSFIASGLKEERTLAMSFSRKIGKLRMGVTGKHLHHSYTIGSDSRAAADPVFKNGTSKSAIGFDAGLMASISGPLKMGVAVRNLNQPDVGLVTEDRVPREIQAGLFLDVGGLDLRTSADLFFRDNGFGSQHKDHYLPALGFEKGVVGEKLVMRLGANPLEFTGGFGVRMGRIGFDYGIVISRGLINDNLGSHRMGMSYRFGDISKSAKKKGGAKSFRQSFKETNEDDLWRDGFFGIR